MAKKPKVRSPRRRKRRLIVALTLLALIIFAGWYFNSSAFHSYVRGRLIAKLEEVTGGHAEIGRVEWSLSKLEFIFYDVTIHGREAAPEAPFVHIDRVYVRAKILSLLRRQIGLRYLEADHPVIHIITYPDGTTNQPAPVQRMGTANLQDLFQLAADRMELRDGVFILNEQNIPLDVSAGDVRAVLTFDRQFNRYDGTLHIGTLYTQYLNFRPVVAVAQMEFSVLPKALAVKKLEISSDRSRITITGSITDFREPDVQASYTASINIGQAGEIMLLPRLRSGTANVEGTATYRAGRYRASGRVSVHNATFADGGMVIPGVTGQGNFLAENEGISLTGVHCTALGGSFTGSGRMEIAATPDSGRPTPQRGSAQVRFSGLDAEQVR